MSKNSKKVKIGIMPFADFKNRTLAIVKGEYRPKAGEPKIWFSSIKSLAQVLSEENQQLLRLIIDNQPKSISELEPLTGRKASNLLRTLRTMESYGLVKLEPGKAQGRGRIPLVPVVVYELADIEINFCSAHS